VSRKNHKLVDGQLLQMDKRFSDLKMAQREKVALWLKAEYESAIDGRMAPLSKFQKDEIARRVYERIKKAQIWIPYGEVRRYFSSKLPGWNRKHFPPKDSVKE
jgi:8-oxo-dGTP diphosphatase